MRFSVLEVQLDFLFQKIMFLLHEMFLFPVANSTSSFYLLPSCDGCLVFVINSTARNIKHLLKLLKINIDASDEFVAHSVYLLGRMKISHRS